MITGLSHVTLSVVDLDRAFRFYTEVLALRPHARWSRGAYLSAGGMWLCLTLDARRPAEPHAEYTHIALAVAAPDFDQVAARIRGAARIWKDNASEGDSLYFLDPDGHKLELHVGDLASRLAACRSAPYDGMIFY